MMLLLMVQQHNARLGCDERTFEADDNEEDAVSYTLPLRQRDSTTTKTPRYSALCLRDASRLRCIGLDVQQKALARADELSQEYASLQMADLSYSSISPTRDDP